MDQPRPWTEHTDGAPFDLPEPGTLVGAWAATLSGDPDRPLLHGPWGGGGTRWVGRGEFLEHTVLLAGRLVAAGLEAGDRVLVSGPSSVDLAAVHVACLRAGLVVVPVNGGYREAELAHLVRDCAPRAALVDDDGWADLLAGLVPDLLVADTKVDLPDGNPGDRLDCVAPGDPALLGYTSGTTGRPKGAVLTQLEPTASADVRPLVSALVRPMTAVLAYPRGRRYVRIVAQLSDRFPAWQNVPGGVDQTHLTEALVELEARANGPDPTIRSARLVAMIRLMTSSLAARAVTLDSGVVPLLDDSSYERDLTDVLVGVLTTPSTLVA